MNMAITYVPIGTHPNPASQMAQTYPLLEAPAPQMGTITPTEPIPETLCPERTSPSAYDLIRRLSCHRNSISCAICLYLLFAYGVYLFFGETHHGFDTFMAWCMLFCVCYLLVLIWDVKVPQVEELPAPATMEPVQRSKTQMFAASLIVVAYIWLLYWAVGTFKSWLLFLTVEVWLIAAAGVLIELWMAV